MKSDKLRVVFDASAKTSNGVSLNDALRIGPTVQEDLFKIVLRFRTRRVAFVADIIKMYRQILVDPEQTIFQQILWREKENAPLESYRLLTVTYGEASSSYLATRCLSWLADTHNASHPMAAGVLKRDFYMDDVLTGAETIEEAQELKTELIDLLKKGCFELSKWSTNSPELVSTIPLNHRKSGSILGTSMDGVRTLGLSWDTSNDALYCWTEMEPNNISGITKRKVCSTIARIYDPLGLFAPAVVRAKIFLQSLWQTKLEWDQALPLVLHENWREIFILLNSLKTKSVPRLVLPICKPKRIDIHGFCDASEVAYGACIYIRSTGDSVSDVSVNLLCSKSRVAPVKQLSIPRLELCGAVLLSRLLAQVTSALDCVINEIFLWSDSMIVLAWLKDTPGRWKTFVANRVSEVQHLCSKSQWGHVRSADNPADLLSRGIKDITELSDLWWRGPAWLSQPPGAWPATGDAPTNVPEARMVNVVAMVPEKWIIENYSSWEKLSNVVSYCMRFIFNCRVSRSERKLGLLNVHERERSQHSVLKLVQLCGFPEEHKKLSNAQIVRTGVLSSLDVFLDDNGLIRVGGRLANANLSYAERHPIVLPSSHHVTTLIIRNQHEKQLHANTQAVLSVLRCTYWIIHGRSSVRRVIRACIQCKKCLKETGKQQMGNLPSARVCPARPFETTGVDYGGPFKIRQNLLRRASSTKGYVALFVCLVTKAIHLELVTDLRTASFIAALKRFTSRRGLCKKIYSDNGTTFVGTCHEFERLWASKQHQESIVNYAISNRISFNFIPPLAPHQGGLWEAGIKSVKYHLQRVIGNTELTYEEFSTVLCQVEACLNSRPLVPLSENPEEYDILTPAHFLIGAPLVAPIQEDVPEPPRSRTDRWKLIQHLTQQIWRRWQREYLQHLQVRGKWKCPYPNIKIGTLVLMKDSTAMPASWSLGRVTEVQFGTDGLVRSVRIKTAQGLYTRAIQQVVPLLSEDSVV